MIQYSWPPELVKPYTFTELANVYGVTRQTLYKWLAARGHNRPKRRQMVMVDEVLAIFKVLPPPGSTEKPLVQLPFFPPKM
jgi:hypothetical protein